MRRLGDAIYRSNACQCNKSCPHRIDEADPVYRRVTNAYVFKIFRVHWIIATLSGASAREDQPGQQGQGRGGRGG